MSEVTYYVERDTSFSLIPSQDALVGFGANVIADALGNRIRALSVGEHVIKVAVKGVATESIFEYLINELTIEILEDGFFRTSPTDQAQELNELANITIGNIVVAAMAATFGFTAGTPAVLFAIGASLVWDGSLVVAEEIIDSWEGDIPQRYELVDANGEVLAGALHESPPDFPFAGVTELIENAALRYGIIATEGMTITLNGSYFFDLIPQQERTYEIYSGDIATNAADIFWAGDLNLFKNMTPSGQSGDVIKDGNGRLLAEATIDNVDHKWIVASTFVETSLNSNASLLNFHWTDFENNRLATHPELIWTADSNGDFYNSKKLTTDTNDDGVYLGNSSNSTLLSTGFGNDYAFGGGGSDHISGGDGDDYLFGDYGSLVSENAFFSQSGEDILNGGSGRDYLFGGYGNDTLIAGDEYSIGGDYYHGGSFYDSSTINTDGVDTLDYSDFTRSINLTLAGKNPTISTIHTTASLSLLPGIGSPNEDSIYSIESFILADKSDYITLTDAVDYDIAGLDAGLGDNVIDFSQLNQSVTVDLFHEDATHNGGKTIDNLEGIFQVIGGSDNDEFYGRVSAAQFDGGAGDEDLLSYGFLDSGRLVVDLSGAQPLVEKIGIAGEEPIADSVDNIEWFEGTARNDFFRGKEGLDGIIFDGFDNIGGRDILDFFTYQNGVTVDLVGGSVTDALGGTITINDFEQVNGSNHADTITGSVFSDWLFGQGGIDIISGGGGADYLIGGSGADILDGGVASDTYYYKGTSGLDTIIDSQGLSDRIYLGGSEQFFEGIVTTLSASVFKIDDVANFTADIELLEFSDRANFQIENLVRVAPDMATLNVIEGVDLPSDPQDPDNDIRNDEVIDGTENGDYIDGKEGDDIISASEGDDVISDSVGYNIIHGGSGHDWITGHGELFGDGGSDHITGTGIIFGGAGEDFLTGLSSTTVLDGGSGNDYFTGEGKYFAGNGIDVVDGNGEIWLAFGSEATTRYDVAENGSVVISLDGLSGNNKVVFLDGESNFLESDISFNDGLSYVDTSLIQFGYLTDEFENEILGGAGNFTFVASEAQGDKNVLNSFLGTNTYLFDQNYSTETVISSSDVLPFTTETIVLDSVSSASELKLIRDGSKNEIDLHYGNSGLISFAGTGLSSNFVFDINGTQHNLNTLEFETRGSNGDDELIGDLDGFSVHDVIYGEYGDDEIDGATGDDTIDGGFGDDIIIGGEGFNTYIDSSGDDTYITQGNDLLYAGDGENLVQGDLTGFTVDLTNSGPANTIYRDLDVEFSNIDYKLAYDSGSITLNDFNMALAAPTLSLSDGTTTLLTNIVVETRGTDQADIYSDDSFSLLNPNDVIYAGAGDDNIDLYNGDDIVYGGAGDDNIALESGLASVGNTVMAYGEDGDDFITGGFHDDYISGGDGNDELVGWAGNDILEGGLGNDIYFFEQEFELDYSNGFYFEYVQSGDNTIWDEGGIDDGIGLAATTNITDVIIETDGDDLTIHYSNGTVLIKDQFEESGEHTIEKLGIFENGSFFPTTYSLISPDEWYSSIFSGGTSSETLTGNVGDNVINGFAGDDILDGLSGTDILNGGLGDDTYLFDLGYGTNTINEDGGFDIIELASGITLGDITFTQVGLDLDIQIASGFIVTDFFSGDADKLVEQILFADGSTFDLTSLLPATNTNDFFDATSAVEHFDGGTEGTDTVSYADSAGRVTVDLENNIGTHNDAAGDTYNSIERIIGTNHGQDSLYGDAGDNILLGLDGSDDLEGGAGADILDGGDNTDYARYSRSDAGVDVDLNRATQVGGHAQGDTLINIEHFYGTNYDDVFRGNGTYNNVIARGGDDILEGRGGSDRLYGGADDDTYIYEGGQQQFFEESAGIDRVEFAAVWAPEDAYVNGNTIIFDEGLHQITFNDITLFETFNFDGHGDLTLQQLINLSGGAPVINNTPTADDDTLIGTAVAEVLDGGVGNDTVSYAASAERVTVDLENNTATYGNADGDTFVSVENIIGTQHGSDNLYGDAGTNILYGLDGGDYLEGGAGADRLDGGDGTDFARYIRSDGAVVVDLMLNVQSTTNNAHATGDELVNIEHLYGTAYDDAFYGNDAYNQIYGREGNDVLYGRGGSDRLYGGDGNDILVGGEGVDLLYGQAGADTFVFSAIYEYSNSDNVQDFLVSDGDKIDISEMLVGYDPLTDAITDFAQITDNGTNSYLSVDIDGGADNFIQIATLFGEIGLTDEAALEINGTLVTSV